jgi:hypothetical protein
MEVNKHSQVNSLQNKCIRFSERTILILVKPCSSITLCSFEVSQLLTGSYEENLLFTIVNDAWGINEITGNKYSTCYCSNWHLRNWWKSLWSRIILRFIISIPSHWRFTLISEHKPTWSKIMQHTCIYNCNKPYRGPTMIILIHS